MIFLLTNVAKILKIQSSCCKDFEILCNIWISNVAKKRMGKDGVVGFWVFLYPKNSHNESPSLGNFTHKWLVSLIYQKDAHEYEVTTSNATVQTFIRNKIAHEHREKPLISAVHTHFSNSYISWSKTTLKQLNFAIPIWL